jgi:hypothetical protein
MGASIKLFVCASIPGPLHFPVNIQLCSLVFINHFPVFINNCAFILSLTKHS